MIVLLVIVGAVLIFAAGWAWGRTARPIEAPPAEPPRSPSRVAVDDVLDAHPTGVVVAGANGAVRYRNPAARRLTGTHAGVLLDEAIERHAAIANRGVHSDETVEFYGPPRTVFDVRASPLPSGGSVVFIDDISERRRSERVRTDFVANVSHELKTPIGALSVLAETLLGETDPATVERVVNRMLAEADRAAHTIDDLMELSRIEAGGERTTEPVRLSDVIRVAHHRVVEMAAQREVAVSILDPVDAAGQRADSLVVLGDRRQLDSAIGNLVENAVKYSEPGGSVQVRARSSGEWAEVSVSDHGIGIPQRDLDRIFERFYRVDRARSRATGGTGLGLAIVRHVATNHGGEVIVTSVEGEGSTFVLRLPIAGARNDIGDARGVGDEDATHAVDHVGGPQPTEGVA